MKRRTMADDNGYKNLRNKDLKGVVETVFWLLKPKEEIMDGEEKVIGVLHQKDGDI